MVELGISILFQYFMYIFGQIQYIFKVLKTDFTIQYFLNILIPRTGARLALA